MKRANFYQCECAAGSTVVDSRIITGDGPPAIRRRRECPQCKWRFTTIEVIADTTNHAQRSRVPYDSEAARQDRKLWNQRMIRKLAEVIGELRLEE